MSKKRLTKQKQHQDKTVINERNYLREHDQLTGFVNLTLIRHKIDRLIQARQSNLMAVMLLDIDNFRFVNDTMGIDIGDLLLRKISKRIISHCGDYDILARKGGDEFIIVISNTDPRETGKKARLILHSLSKMFIIKDQPIFITATLGISFYPQDSQNVEELFAHADYALNQAKEDGKNGYRVYTKKMGEREKFLQLLEKNLAQAMGRNELFVEYQPQIDISSKKMIGVEALLRWKNPSLGFVSPKKFIPIAEKNGWINAIGDWTLKMACFQCKYWQISGLSVPISVNVSPRQFQSSQFRGIPHIIRSVQTALRESELSPQFLELEITESVLMKDDAFTKNTLKKLRDMGVKISCDDFGVGYSSFSRFKQLAIDTIKIDQSLISDIQKHEVDKTIVKAIITIAEQLKIKVIAEGVNSEIQCQILHELGCDIAQGFYFGKPMRAKKIMAFKH